MYKNKYSVGQHVCLFNSVSGKIEHDSVYGVLFVPIAVEGKQRDESKTIAEQIEAGLLEVKEQYQTLQHGIVNAEVLFTDEEECKEFYRGLFAV